MGMVLHLRPSLHAKIYLPPTLSTSTMENSHTCTISNPRLSSLLFYIHFKSILQLDMFLKIEHH